jgi:hypothetical protein
MQSLAAASQGVPVVQPAVVISHECPPSTEPIYLSWFREAPALAETVPEL